MNTKQGDFFKYVIDTKNTHSSKKDLKLYRDLVFHRFFEVLSNANPILYELVNKKRFKKAVKEFIKYGAKTDFIWQVPNEFRKFIKTQKNIFKDLDYLDDLLWFEWIEIKLFMNDYKDFKINKFGAKNKYRLSKAARVKKLSYKVYERDFKTKGEFAVLSYYDIVTKEVIFREISLFMYEFIKLISKSSVKESILNLSEKYEIDSKELRDILNDPLKELCSLGVLKKIKD